MCDLENASQRYDMCKVTGVIIKEITVSMHSVISLRVEGEGRTTLKLMV